jgi:c-di-GMP-binding flagellar brake protein YcgR
MEHTAAGQHYSTQAWPISRQFVRAALQVPVVLEAAGAQYRGWTLNISEGGLAITVAAPLRIGSEVSASFDLAENSTLKIKAVVRHSDGFRYGFEFLSISPDGRQAVRNFVARPPQRRRGA